MVWDDTRIELGDSWQNEIDVALSEARVAILLVSADFLASPFIRKREIPQLLAAAEAGGATIIPIVIAPCLFAETASLSRFQAANSPTQPLTSLGRSAQEEVFLRVARRVASLLRKVESSTGVTVVDTTEGRTASPVREFQVPGDRSHPARRRLMTVAVLSGVILVLVLGTWVYRWPSNGAPVSAPSVSGSTNADAPTHSGCTPEPPENVKFVLNSPTVVVVENHGYGLLTPKGYIIVPDYVIDYSVQRKEPFRIRLQSKDKNEPQAFSARIGRKSGAVAVICPMGVSWRVRSLDYVELDELRAGATGELFRGPTDRISGKIIRTSVTSMVLGGRPDNTIEGLVEVFMISKQGDAGAPFVDPKMRVVGILYAGDNQMVQFLPMSTIVKALPEAF